MSTLANSIAARLDSLESWSGALARAGIRLDSGDIFESKATRFRRLRERELLRTPCVTVSVDRFLASPAKYLRTVPGERLMPFLDCDFATDKTKRFSSRPIAREDFIPALNEATGEHDRTRCVITFLKAFKILCNGNIIIRRDGDFYAEFVYGSRSPSQQNVRIDCVVRRDPFLRIFRYSSDDLLFRRRLYGIFSSLPEVEGGGEYRPGYYEVALGCDHDIEIPLFYDFRESSFFIG